MDAYRLYRRIIKCIKEDQIEGIDFKKLPDDQAGQLWLFSPPKRAIIIIDPKKEDILSTFIHEMVHFLYPHFGELRVKKWVKWWTYNSSWKSKKILLKFLLKY
uniref:Uncharacterized protein n=1 Tax=viral metagenome TaxID=1070528 RepID=A0A6M3JJS9_9ZZZZ